MGDCIATQDTRRAGSYIDEAAGIMRLESMKALLAQRQIFIAPPSNCPANSAHHWLIAGRNQTCKHCGEVQRVKMVSFSEYGRGHLKHKGRKF